MIACVIPQQIVYPRWHALGLANAQKIMILIQFVLPRHSISDLSCGSQKAPYGRNQLMELKGLRQHLISTQQSNCTKIDSRMLSSRHGKNRKVWSQLTQFSNGFYTILSGHHDICNNERRKVFPPKRDAFGPVLGLPNGMTCARQSFGHNVAIGDVIIDHEYFGHRGTCRPRELRIRAIAPFNKPFTLFPSTSSVSANAAGRSAIWAI